MPLGVSGASLVISVEMIGRRVGGRYAVVAFILALPMFAVFWIGASALAEQCDLPFSTATAEIAMRNAERQWPRR